MKLIAALSLLISSAAFAQLNTSVPTGTSMAVPQGNVPATSLPQPSTGSTTGSIPPSPSTTTSMPAGSSITPSLPQQPSTTTSPGTATQYTPAAPNTYGGPYYNNYNGYNGTTSGTSQSLNPQGGPFIPAPQTFPPATAP